MTYATLITQYRAQSGDTKRRVHVDWTGDGSTTVFQLPSDTFPVFDGTGTEAHTLKVAGSTQTEGVNYSLDKDAGTIVFITTAPTNGQAVTFDGIATYLKDSDWLVIINDTIRSLGDDFWKEFVDSAHTATANMLSLSLVALQVNCIAVYEFQRRGSSTEDWHSVEEDCNWRYDRDNNIIYIGIRDAFTTTGEALRIRGLKTYTIGTATSDTLDVQDKYLTILEHGAMARYYRWRYKHVIEVVSKVTQENTRTPLQDFIMLSDRAERLYADEKAKLKPQKPTRIIPPYKQGGGRP